MQPAAVRFGKSATEVGFRPHPSPVPSRSKRRSAGERSETGRSLAALALLSPAPASQASSIPRGPLLGCLKRLQGLVLRAVLLNAHDLAITHPDHVGLL